MAGAGADISPERTLAVLLGVSRMPMAPRLAQGRAFSNSARHFYEYLVSPTGMRLLPENIHDLFDSDRPPLEQLSHVSDFLASRCRELESKGTPATDLIVCYVGHGLFCPPKQAFHLTIQLTEQGAREALTSLPASMLAQTLNGAARLLRKYLLVDCCFSAAAFAEFQGAGPGQAVREQLLTDLPLRGATLLCSVSNDDAYLVTAGLEHTMFSDGLLRALQQGSASLGSRLSLCEMGDLIKHDLEQRFPETWVRPEVHSPYKLEGDVASIGIFPNPAHDKPRLLEAERQRQAELARKDREERQRQAARAAERRQQEQEVEAIVQAELDRRRQAERDRPLQKGRRAAADRQAPDSAGIRGGSASGVSPWQFMLTVLGLTAVIVVAYVAWHLGHKSAAQVARGRVFTSSSVRPLAARQGSKLAAASLPATANPSRTSADLVPASDHSDTTAQRMEVKPFRDCEAGYCPWMVMIPPGRFDMGSPSGEKGREANEGPVHEVKINHAFAAGEFPITRGEWRAYLAASGRTGSNNCSGWNDSKRVWEQKPEYNWLNPGFPQDDNHPVVCVTWDEARVYAAWLTQQTHHQYRLLSEAEYEYINRAGASTAYFWGDTDADQCLYANGADAATKARFDWVLVGDWTVAACNDGHVYTSPVGSLKANRFGLYDTTGNAWSWTQDCYHASYRGAPADGTAWLEGGDCSRRVLRGGAWVSIPDRMRAGQRLRYGATFFHVGLRVARTTS